MKFCPAKEGLRDCLPRRRGGVRGFTLVEVAMSLGILSFALTAILGLLSVGMTSFRGSLDRTMESQLLEWSYTQARSTYAEDAFASMDEPQTFYFDADGLWLPEEGVGSANYSATLRSTKKLLPGSSQEIWGINVEIRAVLRGNQLLGSHAFWFSD